jgi:hypothetical protein
VGSKFLAGIISFDQFCRCLLLTEMCDFTSAFYYASSHSCKRVKPDWDILADTAHSSVFIGDVNCMVENDLCAGHHTGNNWPTIMVYKRGKEELYTGGLGLENLKTFVDETLVEPCNIGKMQESCNFKEKFFIAKWEGKSPAAYRKEIGRLSKMDTHSMTYDLKKWLRDRVRILEQLSRLEASNDL